jgi:putative ABC transport system permease protein
VRKAIGAKRSDILRQFLIEAVVVSGSGGIIGILCGILLSAAVGSLMSIDTAISPQVVGISFGFSVLVGILFGLYPANKAAKLNPIEALRFE